MSRKESLLTLWALDSFGREVFSRKLFVFLSLSGDSKQQF